MLQATNKEHAGPQVQSMPGDLFTPAQRGQLSTKGVSQSDTPEPIRAARAVLAGKLPFVGGLELDVDPMKLDASWPWFMFTPEREIESITRHPERRTALRLRFCEDLEDEREIHAEELSPRGVERVRELLAGAIDETVSTLATLANDMDPTHRNTRLSARFCQAAREELAELLREWDEVAS